MEVPTNLQNNIDATDPGAARYDASVKETLSDVQVLARILKYTTTEFRNMAVEDIIPCIDQDSILVGEEFLDPGLSNLGKVKGLQTEDAVPNEGKIVYDIRFAACRKGEGLKILVNVEAQKSTKRSSLGYDIENRILFYLGRQISSQKDREFFRSDFDSLKKVISIWICMDTPDDEDSITRISLSQKAIYGKQPKLKHLDKMTSILVRIRERPDVLESKNKLISMLEDLLSTMDKEEKKCRLKEKHGMRMTVDLERRVDVMCNLSSVVMEKGIEKGIQKGKAEAEKAMVTAMLREGGIPAEKIFGFCSHLTLNDIKKLEAELSLPL